MAYDTELDVEALAEALSEDDDGRRLLALDALQECDRRGPLPERVLGPLLACLASRRKAVQRTAAEVIALWSRATPGIQERLLAALSAGELHARWGAAYALAKIGGDTTAASLPVLVETLGQADGDMRWAAEGIVVDLARRRPEVREALARLAAGGTPTQRKMALYCLRDLGDPTRGLSALLMATLEHPDADVRLAALSALAGLFGHSPETAAAVVRAVRDDPEPRVRRAAVGTLGKLGKLGPSGGSVEDEVERVLDEAAASDDESLRRAALGARKKRAGAQET